MEFLLFGPVYRALSIGLLNQESRNHPGEDCMMSASPVPHELLQDEDASTVMLKSVTSCSCVCVSDPDQRTVCLLAPASPAGRDSHPGQRGAAVRVCPATGDQPPSLG